MSKAVDSFRIGGRPVGADAPCLIIAEAGVNHNGNMGLAMKLIDAAVDAGADVVKFQMFKTEETVTRMAPMAAYQEANTGRSESQFDMIRRLELKIEDFVGLKARCEERNVIFMCSPFDIPSVDALVRMDVAAFKVASGEITNFPILRRIGAAGKPVVLSTGMSMLDEVKLGVDCLLSSCIDVALLHAVSLYPTPPEDVNLRAMATLRKTFGLVTGFSDHTLGITIPTAAVAMGAKIIEKHFTLDKTMEGPDHKASLDPEELKDLVRSVRMVEAALGSAEKRPTAAEEDTRRVARKSLVILRDRKAGDVLSEGDIGIKRPGTGLPPSELMRVLGKRLVRPVVAGELLTVEDMDGY